MKNTSLLHTFTAFALTIALATEADAQVNSWRQQPAPSYYYGYHPTYQHPSYYYQQYPQGVPPAPTPAQTPETRPTVRKSTKPAKRTPAVDTSRWLTDFDTAWALAQNQGKPLVAIFTHHGCPECSRMDSTLAQPGAASSLENAVKVRVEFTQNPVTVQRFGVKLTPTFIVLSPANGEVYREVGALSIDRLFQLKPSIDSLLTAPQNSTEKKNVSNATAENSTNGISSGSDDETSRTVASL